MAASSEARQPANGTFSTAAAAPAAAPGAAGRLRLRPEDADVAPHVAVDDEADLPPLAFFATCHPGLEQVVADELLAMGASAVETRKAGVAFRGHSLADGYRASLRLRSAVRVLCEVAHGDLDTDERSGRRAGTALYELTREAVDWPATIPRGCTFSIEPRLWSCTGLTSSALVYTRVKDAICDALLDARGERPNPPDGPADVPLFVTLYQDRVTFYRDMCGTSLHRRGYRDAMHKASLNESVAAGLLHLAGWHRAALRPDGAVLADPMCGSGTILIEAALLAANVAPGLLRPPRSWPFQTWQDFEPRVWEACVEAAQEDVRPWDGELFGNDIHPGALELAQRDAQRAGVSEFITWSLGDCRTWAPPTLPDIVITNPPWGGRLLGEEDRGGGMQERDSGQGGRRGRLRSVAAAAEEDESPELVAAWKSIDYWLAHQGKGTQAHVFSGNRSMFKHIWLKPSRRQPIVVSGVDTRLFSYVIKKKGPQGGAQDGAA